MCVSMPMADCVLETVPEDDAYMLQVGAPAVLCCAALPPAPAALPGGALLPFLPCAM